MNAKLALAMFLLARTVCAADVADVDENLYPFWLEKTGYINAQGEVVIKPQFDEVDFFLDGIAAVKLDGKWGFINRKGEMLVKPQFDGYHYCACVDGNLIVVTQDGKHGLINSKGELVVKPQFDWINPLGKFGLLEVRQNNKTGVINKDGKMTAPIEYDQITGFHEHQDVAEVWQGGKCGFINQEGKVVAKPQFRYIHSFNKQGVAAILDSNQKVGFVNNKGIILIAPQFDDFRPGDGGLKVIVKDEKLGLVSATGELIAKPKFDTIRPFQDGLAAAQLNGVKRRDGYLLEGGWGYLNEKGETVIDHQFEDAKDFKDGWAVVKKDGKWGYINTQGAWVISPRFSEARNFADDGLAVVKYQGVHGFINKSGEWVIRPQFNGVGDFAADGLAVAQEPGYVGFGYINRKGEWVIRSGYGDALNFDHGLARVQRRNSNEWRLIDEKNNTVASGFDSIGEFNEYGTAYYRKGYGKDIDVGLIDTTGKIIVKNLGGMYLGEGYLKRGLARIHNRKTGLSGLMTLKGKILLKPDFHLDYFGEDDLAKVSISVHGENGWRDRWGIVNTKGEFIIKPVADRPIGFHKNGLGILIQDGKWGIVSKEGQMIVKPRFGYIQDVSIAQGGLILALDKDIKDADDSEWYYLDRNGNVVFYSETVAGKRMAKNAKGEIIWQ